MSKTNRRILFYLFAIAFFAASYVAILYAQGYKYNFGEQRFFRTGAISLKMNETAKVFVDDELIGEASFFNGGYGIDGLLPGRYVVRLQRDGASPWQKTVTVEEGAVTDFPNILLIPTDEENTVKIQKEIETLLKPSPLPTRSPSPSKKPSSTASPSPTPVPGPFAISNRTLYGIQGQEREALDGNVSGFSLSEDSKKLLWWNANELWVMWLADTGYQPFKKKNDRELITRFSTPIGNAAWFRGEDHVVIDSHGYKIVEIDTRGGINIIKL